MNTDLTDFVKGQKRVEAEVRARCKIGMRKAITHHFNDVLYKEPKPPYRDGSLRASHSIFVDGVLIKTSETEPMTEKGRATPQRNYVSINLHPNVTRGTLIAHRAYAASIHEGVSRHGTKYIYKTEGTGKKWIWSKLIRYKEDYTKDISLALL